MPTQKHLPNALQITLSVLFALVCAWLLGLFVFFGIVASQTPENPDKLYDAAVVLTGGPGRVEAGFKLIVEGRAKSLLISGVHPDTTLKNLVDLWDGNFAQKAFIMGHCCITIGHVADTTESNAAETSAWLAGKNIETIRIVTNSYHMPRAWILFRRALPTMQLSVWPVTGGSPFTPGYWRQVLIEYTKTLMTWMS